MFKIEFKRERWRRAVSVLAVVGLVLGEVSVAMAQLPYTPLTTPLYGGSANQPPQPGTEVTPAPAPTPLVPPSQPGTSTSFRPQGSGLPSLALPTRGLSFHPRVLVRETYSDNINLAPSSRAQSDLITEVIPGFDLQAAGSRVQGSLHYSLQGVAYLSHSKYDHIYNQASANGTGVILPNHLFLRANTAYSQAVINPAAPGGTNNIFVTGNTTNAWVSRVNPYWLQSLGRVGTSTLSYAFGNIQYASGRLSDSHSNTYQATLTSPSGNDRWSWNGDLREYHDWISNGIQIIQRDVQGELGYRIYGHFTLLADGGWEYNEQKRANNSIFKGPYWAAGFRWSSPFNVFQFKYGHRFFGKTYNALWEHRAARVVTRISYDQTVSYVNLALQEQALGASVAQLYPNFPLSSLNVFDLYVSKRFAGSIQYNYSKTRVQLTAFDERREYLTQPGSDHVTGVTLADDWKFAPRTSVLSSFTWAHDRFRGGQSYILTSPQVSLRYMVDPTAFAEVGYRYEHRNANVQSSSFAMNMIYAEFSKTF